MSLEVQLYPGDSDFISSEWICKNEIAVFCVKAPGISFKILLVGFRNDLTSFCSQQRHGRTILHLHPCQHLLLCAFLAMACLTGVRSLWLALPSPDG